MPTCGQPEFARHAVALFAAQDYPELPPDANSRIAVNRTWMMDGANQRAVIEAFFEPVAPGDPLVFIYLKHSPLQEERTDRLLTLDVPGSLRA
jgi:hypothetical protein